MIDLLDQAKLMTFTPDEIKTVAMAQAMTSSHGNEELSKCVAELYSETPKQAWNYVVYERERLETDKSISVKIDESDYSCDARIFDNRFYNTESGDGFELDNTSVILALTQLISNGLEFVNIIKELKSAVDNNTKLVIIAPDGADPKVRMQIEEIIGPKGNKNIGIFNIPVYNPRINDHIGLLTTFGIRGIESDKLAAISSAKVTYSEGKLSIFNVLTKTTDMLHPQHKEESSYVFKYLKLLEDYVEGYKKSTVADTGIDESVKDARRIYNAILLQKQGRIVIGGAAYDNQAMLDVVQDTMKATRATLLEGASLGGYMLLKQCLVKMNEDSSNSELVTDIISAYLSGIKTLSECSMRHLPSTDVALLKVSADTLGVVYNVAIKCVRELKDCLDPDKCVATVLQPITVDKELIKRFGEVALKFLFTNRVIIPGGVVIDQEKDKSS
jgi:hypothetical protein